MFIDHTLSFKGILGLSMIACVFIESIISFILLNPFFLNRQNYIFLNQVNNYKRSLLIIGAVIETPFVLSDIIMQNAGWRFWIILAGLTILTILTVSTISISWRTFKTLKEGTSRLSW